MPLGYPNAGWFSLLTVVTSYHGSESGAAPRYAANLSKLPPHHVENGTQHSAREMGEAMARMRGAGMIVNDMSSLARSVEQYDISSDEDTSGKRVTVSPVRCPPLPPPHQAPAFLSWLAQYI